MTLCVGGPYDGREIAFVGDTLEVFEAPRLDFSLQTTDCFPQPRRGSYRRSDANPDMCYWEGWL